MPKQAILNLIKVYSRITIAEISAIPCSTRRRIPQYCRSVLRHSSLELLLVITIRKCNGNMGIPYLLRSDKLGSGRPSHAKRDIPSPERERSLESTITVLSTITTNISIISSHTGSIYSQPDLLRYNSQHSTPLKTSVPRESS